MANRWAWRNFRSEQVGLRLGELDILLLTSRMCKEDFLTSPDVRQKRKVEDEFISS
jgi:hypothetical protein